MPHQNRNYQERFTDYINTELHPETAKMIGEIVLSRDMPKIELAMSIIIQMQLDHFRKDADLDHEVHVDTAWDERMVARRKQRHQE